MKNDSNRILKLVILLAFSCIAFAASPVHADDAKKEPAWQPVEKTTFEERTKAHLAYHPVPFDALMIPFTDVQQLKPMIAKKGQKPGFAGQMERYIDRYVPLDEKHEEYLAKRTELADAPLKLIAWCQQNKLGECVEYEARRGLDRIRDFNKTEYKPYLRAWLAERDKLQISYSFPLPLSGEWFVVEDKTKHHRLKYGAAYAFDMVRKINGSQCRGQGLKNEEHYAWGEPILAQADGVVTVVVDTFEDNRPRVLGGFNEANVVTVNYGGGISAIYGHCQKGSARVKVGDQVKFGDTLALVGNSGASGAPHLHFTMLDAGHVSIKGRFTFQASIGKLWKSVEGEDLPEGRTVRNVVTDDAPLKLFD
ncbi:MAG: M23 family metallopeptidase [Phycisphaeraceae bacterium]